MVYLQHRKIDITSAALRHVLCCACIARLRRLRRALFNAQARGQCRDCGQILRQICGQIFFVMSGAAGDVRRVMRCQAMSGALCAVRRCQARYALSGDVRRVMRCQALSGALCAVRRCQARYALSGDVRRVTHKKTAHDSAARIGNKKAALGGLIGFYKVKCNVTKTASPASLIMRSIVSASIIAPLFRAPNAILQNLLFPICARE